MQRSEFYIDVLLEKDNLSDVEDAIENIEWYDDEQEYMQDKIKGLMNDRATIPWDHCLRNYIAEHALTLQQLEDMKAKFEKRFEDFEKIEKEAKEKIEELDQDTPEDIKKSLELQKKFAEVQKNNIEELNVMIDLEYERMNRPKQSLDKVINILQQAGAMDDLDQAVEMAELSKEEKQHILEYLAETDIEKSKELFKAVMQDVKNAPEYAEISDWRAKREELSNKVDEIKNKKLECEQEIDNTLKKIYEKEENYKKTAEKIKEKYKDAPEKMIEEIKEEYEKFQADFVEMKKKLDAERNSLEKWALAEMATGLMMAEAKSKEFQQICNENFDIKMKNLDRVGKDYEQLQENVVKFGLTARLFLDKRSKEQIRELRAVEAELKAGQKALYKDGKVFKNWEMRNARRHIKIWNETSQDLQTKQNEKSSLVKQQNKDEMELKNAAAKIVYDKLHNDNEAKKLQNKLGQNPPYPVKTDEELKQEALDQFKTPEEAIAKLKETIDNSRNPFAKMKFLPGSLAYKTRAMIGDLENTKKAIEKADNEIKDLEQERNKYKEKAIPALQNYTKAVEERNQELNALRDRVAQVIETGDINQYTPEMNKLIDEIDRTVNNEVYGFDFGSELKDFYEANKEDIADFERD